jgi:hypothetical protein
MAETESDEVEIIIEQPPQIVVPKFDWAIYADATFAGLAILIPVPLVDVLVAWYFKRRIPQAVAKRNGRKLPPIIVYHLNRMPFKWWGCLLWPVALTFLLLKRLFRTILYFLTIKEASDDLSYYWHKAFLIDFMMRRGDLDSEESAKIAAAAMFTVLDEITTSPLTKLAQQVVAGMNHIMATTWRWVRRKQEDNPLREARKNMASAWDDFADYFADLAKHYVNVYQTVEAEMLKLHVSGGPVPSTDTLASQLRARQDPKAQK